MYTLFSSKTVQYNRLEPRPRTKDFDKALKTEIADPLWMLTRQWQFGEFKGEDTGSSIFARVELHSNELTHGANRNGGNSKQIDRTIPMEAIIEGQRMVLDHKMALQISRFWKKKLKTAGLFHYFNAFKQLFPFSNPSESSTLEEDVRLNSQTDRKAFLNSISGRAMNGVLFYLRLLKGDLAGQMVLSSLQDSAMLNLLGQDVLDHFESLYIQPEYDENDAWNAQQLEYNYDAAAKLNGGGSAVLSAENYANGTLDWYSFNVNNNLLNKANQVPYGTSVEEIDLKMSVIPTLARFPGMPASRWWEFEDGTVNLGRMNLQHTEIGQLLLSQFGLIYSNDWSLIPFRVPSGSINEVRKIVVTDVFGCKTKVEHASKNEPQGATEKWGMFNLGTLDSNGKWQTETDDRMLLPKTAIKIQESEPIEKVQLSRDEMSNLVWAVEQIIPDGFGAGTDGHAAAKQMEEKYKTLFSNEGSIDVENIASYVYDLVGDNPPENWIPFMPVKISNIIFDQIRLRRAKLKRTYNPTGPEDYISPRTSLLSKLDINGNYSPCYIHEEEVTKQGIDISQTYQRTRNENGKIVLWVGRKKSLARSGNYFSLDFDKISDS